MKGVFIVLEGIDGCGKSTQIKYLSQWLPNSGLIPKSSKLLTTREPGGTDLGENLRTLLLNHLDTSPKPLSELFLYSADRAQHVSEVILPAISQGDWVISDRYSASTMAYQGFGRKLNRKIIEKLEAIATQGIQPTLSILLDISVEESLKRRHNQKNDRIESEGAKFLQRVSDGFHSIANDQNWIIVNANDKKEIVSRTIQEQLGPFLKKIKLNSL